ncbi:DUF5696 domain-containing protein [Neobacillus sp. SCS-31]|uniref:DUF5696 domain-containing protein n=1 Tax=Neobacillus oceani TaxID=3115292 RepID=UPI003906213C
MYRKWLLALVLLVVLFHASAEGITASKAESPPAQQEKGMEDIKYTSVQFTSPEKDTQEAVQAAPSSDGYKKVAENNGYVLYVDEKSLALKIQDKKSGYVWNSGLEDNREYRLNKTWRDLAQSAITVTYTDRKGKLRTEGILTNKTKPKIKKKGNGFSATVNLPQAKISLELVVELKEDGIAVSIPDEKIKESKRTKLISLKLYPFLGAVNENEIDGYMFIPDGSGALIRYQKGGKKADAPFSAAIYGSDQGFQRNRGNQEDIIPVQQIKMPVFGAVHGVKENGFVAVVEKGYEHGEILAYPAGVSTDINWVTSQFHYRHEYYQPTSKKMNGINVYQKNRNPFDVEVRYMFLSGPQADYVGMAKRYQRYLIDSGNLKRKQDRADVRLEFLGSEGKKGLLWDSTIPMTKVEDLPGYVEELKENGVDDMFVVYKGWSKGGLTGTLPAKFPFERKLGSKDDVKNTIVKLEKAKVPIYFYTDYTIAYQGARKFSGTKDVAKKISSETISFQEKGKTAFYLSPAKSLSMAKKDSNEYKDYGMSNLAVDSSGNTLFSDFSKGNQSPRANTMKSYNDIFGILSKNVGGLSLYEPNVYAFGETDRYLDIPMYSSNYVFETDTVPFLQIVLKGYVPYYAPFSNFFSDSDNEVLRLIDYGAYPSFLLTSEPPHLLAKTPSRDVYTSEFRIWKDNIIEQYKIVKDTLALVEGEEITGRHIPEAGISEVTYSNGKTIIVNYTGKIYRSHGIEVPAKGFAVADRGDKE